MQVSKVFWEIFFFVTEVLKHWRFQNQPFTRQTHKMVKHTQTIRRQQGTNCLSVLDHFVGLVLKWLNNSLQK